MIPNEEQTLDMLHREEQITIRIKPEKNNPNYKTERVFVNGVCYQVEVGKEVKVPKTVKELLEKKGII